MLHEVNLITTIAAGLGLALILGFIAVRIKLPPLIGYLIAGIIIGPYTPGFVADHEISMQLAEIGVMLLMFGVGLHFSLGDLLSVKHVALPGAVVQMTTATVIGALIGHVWWGWDWGAAAVFGLSLSCASTVVLLKALEARGLLDSMNGRIAVGWLVVEDLAVILVLVLLPPLAGYLGGQSVDTAEFSLLSTLGITLLQMVVFVALMLIVGKRFFPWLLWQTAKTGSRELFTLCVIAAAVSIAYGSSILFGVSFALGAFFAGMVLRESSLSHRAAEESLPLRDAFAVLFFISVGMLFDPMIVLDQPLKVLIVLAIIIFGKSLAAAALVLLFRYPLNTALTVSASLAQIGEFSFILAGLGITLDLLTPDAYSLILAGAILSIALNPLVFTTIEPVQRWVRKRSKLARTLEQRMDPLAELPMNVEQTKLTGQVVLVGYGRVGSRIGRALIAQRIPFVVAEQNREIVDHLRKQGLLAVSGEASEPAVLIQAHVARARMLIIAMSDTLQAKAMIETARTLNPTIRIIVRTHSDEESEQLSKEGADKAFMGEHELANSMVSDIIEQFAPQGMH